MPYRGDWLAVLAGYFKQLGHMRMRRHFCDLHAKPAAVVAAEASISARACTVSTTDVSAALTAAAVSSALATTARAATCTTALTAASVATAAFAATLATA